VRWLLEQVPSDASVFLAFDCDGLDPSVFPAVSGVSPGGLTYAEAWDLVTGLGGRTVGAVFTEYVPQRDVNELSALAACRLVSQLTQRCVPSTKS
jgi:agmatinase